VLVLVVVLGLPAREAIEGEDDDEDDEAAEFLIVLVLVVVLGLPVREAIDLASKKRTGIWLWLVV
jgi:hypothetical protein